MDGSYFYDTLEYTVRDLNWNGKFDDGVVIVNVK